MALETPEEYEEWALQEFPKDRTGGGEPRKILLSWFARLREQINPNVDQYKTEIFYAVKTLEALQSAFSCGELGELSEASSKRAARFTLWAWPSDETLKFRPKD